MGVQLPMSNKTDVANLICVTQRKTGQRAKVAVISAEHFEDAIHYVAMSSLPLGERAFLTVSMSGGLRFTECLNIRACDIKLEDGIIRIRVLKKKKKMKSGSTGKTLKVNPVYRWIALHPVAVFLLKEILLNKGVAHFARLFTDVKRSTLDRHIRELFHPLACHHSISRHSHITYRFHALKEDPQVVSEQMQITLAVASGYNHIDQREMVKNTWKKSS
jgi:integrase